MGKKSGAEAAVKLILNQRAELAKLKQIGDAIVRSSGRAGALILVIVCKINYRKLLKKYYYYRVTKLVKQPTIFSEIGSRIKTIPCNLHQMLTRLSGND